MTSWGPEWIYSVDMGTSMLRTPMFQTHGKLTEKKLSCEWASEECQNVPLVQVKMFTNNWTMFAKTSDCQFFLPDDCNSPPGTSY